MVDLAGRHLCGRLAGGRSRRRSISGAFCDRSEATRSAALPIALFALALVGTLWSDAPWGARRLCFEPSHETPRVAAAVLSLCSARRAACGCSVAFPGFLHAADAGVVAGDARTRPHAQARRCSQRGIFVKDYINQSQEFALCAVVLAYPIITLLARQEDLAGAVADGRRGSASLANMVFVIVSRTAMVTLPVMLAVFAMLHLKWRTNVILFAAAVVIGALGLDGVASVAGDDSDSSVGNTACTRNSIRPHRSGCGWNSGEKSLRLLCGGAGHRPRHRIDARAVRERGHRFRGTGPGPGDRQPAQPDPQRRGPVGHHRGRDPVRDVVFAFACCFAAKVWRPGLA